MKSNTCDYLCGTCFARVGAHSIRRYRGWLCLLIGCVVLVVVFKLCIAQAVAHIDTGQLASSCPFFDCNIVVVERPFMTIPAGTLRHNPETTLLGQNKGRISASRHVHRLLNAVHEFDRKGCLAVYQ